MNADKQRTIFILSSMGVAVAALVMAAFLFPGNTSAQVWGYGFSAIYILYAIIFKDALLGRFLLFVVFAGFTELIADAWGVGKNTLFYPHNQPMLWDSPMYMPFSWVVVLMQLGFIGFLISNKLKMIYTVLIVILFGMGMVPLYEFMAIKATWWHYENVCTLWITRVPFYVIIAEGLLAGALPVLFRKCQTSVLWQIPLFGIVQGILILVCAMLGYYISAPFCH